MGDEVRVVYGWATVTRWLLLAVVVVASAIVVPMLAGLAFAMESAPGAALVLAAVAGWLLIVALVLWRLALTVKLAGADLRWWTPLRRGSAPIAGARAVRPVPVLALGGVHALVFDGGPALWVLVAKGFADLLADLPPDVDVRLSAAVGRLDRMPGRSQYRRVTPR